MNHQVGNYLSCNVVCISWWMTLCVCFQNIRGTVMIRKASMTFHLHCVPKPNCHSPAANPDRWMWLDRPANRFIYHNAVTGNVCPIQHGDKVQVVVGVTEQILSIPLVLPLFGSIKVLVSGYLLNITSIVNRCHRSKTVKYECDVK